MARGIFSIAQTCPHCKKSTGAVVATDHDPKLDEAVDLWTPLLRDLKDPFVTVEFGSKGGEALVFSRPALVAATDDILTDNGVRAQGSPDMLAVWQAKP